MKKIVSMLIAVLLVITLAACAPKNDYQVNWDIDLNQKIELRSLFQNSGLSDTEFANKERYGIATLERETGYKVEYNQLPLSDTDQVVNQHIQNREQFHFMKLSRAQFEMNVFDEAFLPLDDLLNKWGPNLKANIRPDVWSSATVDGKLYAIPEAGFGYMQDFTLVIRTDMFKEAGITENGLPTGKVKIPETLEEFENALSKLSAKYGDNAQYKPLGYSGSTTVVKPIANALDMPSKYYEAEDGTIKHYVESPEMKEYLQTLGDWVSKGYSAKSFVTVTQQDVMNHLASGKISIGYLPYWYMNPLYEIMKANQMANPQENIDFIFSLKTEDGDYSYIRDETAGNFIVIPFYMAENAGYAIDWIDKKVTDRLWSMLSIGEEGVHYTVDENGKKVQTDRFDEVGDNSFYQTGGNINVGKDCWQLKEQTFNCWNVMLSDEDEEALVKVTALDGAPPFKAFSKLRERGESFMLGNFQNTISQNLGQKGWEAAVNLWKSKTWTAEAAKEVNDWYKSVKNK